MGTRNQPGNIYVWIPNNTGKRFEAVRITPVKVVPGGMTTLLRQKLQAVGSWSLGNSSKKRNKLVWHTKKIWE